MAEERKTPAPARFGCPARVGAEGRLSGGCEIQVSANASSPATVSARSTALKASWWLGLSNSRSVGRGRGTARAEGSSRRSTWSSERPQLTSRRRAVGVWLKRGTPAQGPAAESSLNTQAAESGRLPDETIGDNELRTARELFTFPPPQIRPAPAGSPGTVFEFMEMMVADDMVGPASRVAAGMIRLAYQLFQPAEFVFRLTGGSAVP